MTVNLFTATCLLIICIKHFYKYVLRVPKSQRPLSVTIFYVTSFITILTIIFYTACSYSSERSSNLMNIILAMAIISEVGIQSIAISQASSAMELGHSLRDIRNDTKTQAESLMASPGRKVRTVGRRKSRINAFLWIHVANFFSIPTCFWILSSFIID